MEAASSRLDVTVLGDTKQTMVGEKPSGVCGLYIQFCVTLTLTALQGWPESIDWLLAFSSPAPAVKERRVRSAPHEAAVGGLVFCG